MSRSARPASWPTSTYRVQLHAGFTFDDAAALAPYLAALGVSHLYCSPIVQAAPGSTHGYDVVDHGQLSDDLGGQAAFARLAAAMDEHGLGLVVDTVPNHMALAGSANRWWWDVLEDGPASRYARAFDIEWASPDPEAGPTVLAPVLGDHIGRVLEAGELGLQRRGGTFVVTYADHELPLSPRSLDALLAAAARRAGSDTLATIAAELGSLPHAADGVDAIEERHRGKVELRHRLATLVQLEPEVGEAIDAELADIAADPDALEALLARQNYRLARWRTADDELDYRRFFSIATLVGVRVEDEVVFQESHRLLGELVERGLISGLRIDHIDGLRDPAGYLDRLRVLAPEAWIVVEKILQAGERLPDSWPVQGTSGYDHLTAVNALFVDEASEAAVTNAYSAFIGRHVEFPEIAHDAKRQVAGEELAAETERLTTLLAHVCVGRRRHRDHTRRELRDALAEVMAAFPVYRTYVRPEAPPTEDDRTHVATALASVRERRPDIDAELVDLLGRILLLEEDGPSERELAVRFQQLSAPVMAKGVEDTAFYRYHRLVALNEVGGEPAAFGASVDAFHAHCAHLATVWPDTMLTLSTHDTKRSADVRARIALLSELPDAWATATARWTDHNRRHRRRGAPDRDLEALLYQTLVGTWPIEHERVAAAMAKSAREAKLHTSWAAPDPDYDEAVVAFTEGVLGDRWFVDELEAFLAAHRIVELGRATSLSQVALLATAPGVPDVYQGTELWDHSLVDPDNRRPVDHARRADLLDELLTAGPKDALRHLDDGGAKLWLLSRLLRDRRRTPDRYEGREHIGLAAAGPKARHVVAFRRGPLAVVVPRLLVGLGDDWGATIVALPEGTWQDVLTGALRSGGPQPVADLVEDFPVAVLAADAPDR